MTKATLAFMENKRAGWEAIQPVNDTVTKVTSFVTAIETVDQEREALKTTGLTEDKEQVFETMCKLAFKLASKIKAYAKVTKNNTLLSAVNYSESTLKEGGQAAALTRCKTIHNKALEHVEALVAYQVQPEDTDALKAAIDKFEPLTPQRDATGDERIAKTARLSEIISEIREQLDILDDMVEGMFDEEFEDAYKQARHIIDR